MKKSKPTIKYPPIKIDRLWDHAGRNETVDGCGNQVWRVQDLYRAVENEPVYDMPLIFLNVENQWFDTDGGLIKFAQHMKHVNDADLSYPIILSEWGSILDGRHRIVKAMLLGHTTIKARRVPTGAQPTYWK